MRCRHCGTENPGIHRFCGMCGKPFEPEPSHGQELTEDAPAAGADVPHSSLERGPSTEPERPVPAPAYTGGIFNLGAPSEPSSRNLDYLLEDDEPRSRKGLFLLGLVAIALVVGLGWLRFRQGGIPGLQRSPAKTAQVTTPNAETPASSPTSGNSVPSASTSPATSGGAEQTTGGTTAPAAPTAPPIASPPAPDPNLPVKTAPAPAPAGDGSTPTPTGSPAAGTPPVSAPDSSVAQSPQGDQTTAPAVAPVSAATPEVVVPPKPKKATKPTPANPEDTVALGEKYLYGRGAPQSCDKGLRYVKPAADQSNTKAMITMGALYATGHCLSRDLPTAYRYFALALRQDPDNAALKQNAEMVWGQMTQSERQLAIRMTQ